MTPDGRLEGGEIERLRDLLIAAFPVPQRFTDLLLYRLNRSVHEFAGLADTYQTVVRNTVIQLNGEVRWGDLIREARRVVPGDPGLVAFADDFGYVAPTLEPTPAGPKHLKGKNLELKIKKAQSTFDILPWRRRLGEIESRVCRIEFPENTARGTGFLVGPSVVMTNYHVIERIHKGEVKPSQLVLRFDYKVLANGVTVSAGKAYGLSDDWLIDHSLYSPRDLEVAPAADPALDELDYALLRVQGTPGKDPVGGDTNDPQPTPRHWLEVPVDKYDFSAHTALYIVQHPEGQPLQVAIDSDAVKGLNNNQTRVRYSTTTEPGSSGSPCFGPDWQWVALHHGGDPKYLIGQNAQYNEGIPLAAIRLLLAERQADGALGPGGS